MKKPLARHILLDLYNCRNVDLNDAVAIEAAVQRAAVVAEQADIKAESLCGSGCVHVLASLGEVCVSVHSYPGLDFAAIDIYAATDNPSLTKLRSALRKEFKPMRIKITNMKRGDFGAQKDVKPKSKTRGVAGRRVREAGGKLARFILKKK